MDRVAQGGLYTATVVFQDAAGNLVDPVDPVVDILDPAGGTVVTDGVPVRLSLGNYSYAYAVPADAALGTWRLHWTGLVEGLAISGDDFFEVVAPGVISGISNIVAKARLVTRDFGEAFEFEFKSLGDATTDRFDLPATNIDIATLVVYTELDGVKTFFTPSADTTPTATEYVLDARSGILTLGVVPALDVTLVVNGTGGLWTLPSDIEDFVEIAFDLHAKGRVPALTFENVTPAEQYAIALLAVREALWAEIAEHAHQLDVTTPEGMHIPGGQQFQQLMAMIDRVESHYRELAGALNVGPFRVQMYTLRRVSRTTNRLVPVYVPQEFDDHSTPVRVYPPIDPGS